MRGTMPRGGWNARAPAAGRKHLDSGPKMRAEGIFAAMANSEEAAHTRQPATAFSTIEDELRSAVDTVGGTLPPRRRVLAFAALLRANTLVDDAATPWAMTDGRARALMIQILAWGAPQEFPSHVAAPSSRCPLSDPASNSALPLRAAPRAGPPRSGRAPRCGGCSPGPVLSPGSWMRGGCAFCPVVARATGTAASTPDVDVSTCLLTYAGQPKLEGACTARPALHRPSTQETQSWATVDQACALTCARSFI
jgi:hypothetical protein